MSLVVVISTSSGNAPGEVADVGSPGRTLPLELPLLLMLAHESLWCALARTRGGANRIKIIEVLKERPYNANQLSDKLDVDYRTTRHHLDVLLRSNILSRPEGNSYGTMYFLSETFRNNLEEYERVKACVLEDPDGFMMEEDEELGDPPDPVARIG